MSVSLNKVGDVKLQAGDLVGALAAYQESLDIARRLAAQDPGNALAQRDMAVSLDKVGDVKLQAGDQRGRSPPIRRASTSAASSRRRTQATPRRNATCR